MSHLDEAIAFLRPKGSPFRLVRVGPPRDGGYLAPLDLKGIRHCFSPGVDNRKQFEDDLVSRFRTITHMADFSSDESSFQSPLVEGWQTFEKKWLSSKGGPDSITLEEWVSKSMPPEEAATGEFLLQMDIEGSEYDVIPNLDEELLQKFRIILLELHNLDDILEKERYELTVGPLIEKLDRYFTVIHAHPNNCGALYSVPGRNIKIPEVLEITLVRNDRLAGLAHMKQFQPKLPSPLDVRSNCVSRRPIHLNGEWRIGRIRLDSLVRKVGDYILYAVALSKDFLCALKKLTPASPSPRVESS